MLKLLYGALLALFSTTALANAGADGTWRTESSEEGGYLEVTMAPCATDAGRTCGVISKANDGKGPDASYEHLGKLMVKDMQSEGGGYFSDGTIWDPQADKTYKSKMQVNGNELEVDGCIAFLCSGQTWTRVQ